MQRNFTFSLKSIRRQSNKHENFTVKSSYTEVLLGVTIDSNLSFSEYVTYLCATANRKLHAL